MAECIFCRIVEGKIPCARIYEDDEVLAFLDIGPLAPGHILLIPKRHFERIWEVPSELLVTLVRKLPRLSRALLEATGAQGLNILQNNGPVSGQAVSHLHLHLIPRTAGDGLGYRWNAGRYGPGEIESVQKRILGAMGED